VEGEPVSGLFLREGFRDDLAGVAVDGAEVGGAVQSDVVGSDGRLELVLKPGEIGRGFIRAVVADQLQAGEAAGLQGLGDGADADLLALSDGAQVGAAEPADEDCSHGGGS
jgi:hypothetical protein